jgi:glycerol-1-phosphate dehydrogenase [NAD(P)+]
LSVDACVTNSVAVREEGHVTYRGFVEAQEIIVDTEVISNAPPRLNRAGAGDLLSIHTALWDWRAGERAGRAALDGEVARRAAAVLNSLDAAAEQVRAVTEDGLRMLIDGYAEINDLTVACGHPLMEEGSEHYLGYLLEQQSGKSFVHGELVTLGVVLMSRIQGNAPERARSIAERAGVCWRPQQLGVSSEELAGALSRLREFVQRGRFPYSVANELALEPSQIDELLSEVD